MAKKENFWTDKNVKTLTNMWNKGKTAADIAEALGGVTRNAVIGKANRLGLDKRPSPIKKADKSVAAAPKAKKKNEKLVIHGKKIVLAKEKSFSILDIKEGMCRWPFGDPKDDDFHFCGRNVAVEGCSYCEHHAEEAYQVPTKRR
jgi:GcrA cell cycle regulator